MIVPLIDLRAQYRAIKPHIDAAIQRVLNRGQFVLGPEVEGLEREIAAYCGTRYAVTVASGTDALELSLRASGIRAGDEVITTAFSFFATAEAIVAVGATPVFVDIDPQTYTLDPRQAAAAVTARTTAIMPVHLYGHPCAMEELMALARQRRLAVIEDCAQAIGATLQGRRVGSFGDAGALSFYPSKNLGAYGDGGMIVTSDASVAQRVRLLRNHGSRTRYRHILVGRNSRLDDLQAAVLRVKLRHLDRWNAARCRHAQEYAALFRRRGLAGRIALPTMRPHATHVFSLYTIRTPHRARVAIALRRAGVDTQVAYPSTLPAQPALRAIGRRRGGVPVAEGACRRVLSLPMYPELTRAQIERTVRVIAQAFSRP